MPLAICSCLLATWFPAQSVRLSPPLPRIAHGDVSDFELDGGGGVVFRGDCSRDNAVDLYFARLDGSLAQTRLHPATASGIQSYLVTPDAQHVIFANAEGLHVARLDGSTTPVRLTGSSVLKYAVSPDSGFVLYGHDLHDLFSAPIGGGASVPLEQVGATRFIGTDFTATRDSSRVLYRIKVGDEFELRSQAIGGGPSLLIADTGSVASFKLSQNGAEILFLATTTGAHNGLYRVPSSGGAPIQINPPIPRGAGVPTDYAFDASETRAVFRVTTGPGTDPDSLYELWIAPLDGSTPAVKVNAPLSADGDVLDFRQDGARILYRASGGGSVELFSLPLDLSSSPVSLSAPMLPGMEVSDYVLSAGRALFVSNRLDVARNRLWSVPAAGGTPQEVDGRNLPANASLALDPVGERVLYAAEDSSTQGLFLAPLDASAPALRLDGPAVSGSRVLGYGVSGNRAAYVSSEEIVETFELHSVPLDLTDTPLRLSRATDVFSFVGTVGAFEVAPDGSAAVFITGDSAPVVYTTSLGRPEPVERSLPAGPGAAIGELAFTPNSNAFVYTAPEVSGPTLELFAASTRTHELARRLDALPVAGTPHHLVVGPNSARVFFLAPSATSTAELFTTFLDGRSAPSVLNGPLVAGATVGGSVRAFELTPDGRRVLYLADQEKVNRVELYSVRSSGGPALRLSGDLGFGEDVLEAHVAPDSRRAVFVADDVLDRIDNVYVVALDGSTPALPLTSHVAGVHSVDLLDFTPDGAHVLYRVRLPGGASELRSVALDAAAAPLTLDEDAFDPLEPVFTPDGMRVVYRLASSTLLRSARLDGTEPALTLDDPVLFGSVDHQVTADSLHVVYRKNRQLWRARVDGSAAPELIAPSLTSVEQHTLTRSGRVLVGTPRQLFELANLDAEPSFVAPLDATGRFLATPEGRRVLSVNGELYLDYLTRPHWPR